MRNSDTEMGPVDCGVGAIVWVRRRNGSWWPGKILGADDLSASHVMSPRSGTPVKLLGREDASVDWYNLEKSKRVKPFRCGEFDECIERVEASQGMPPKKREKYARREDAILHALELEKEMLEKNNGNFGCSSNSKSIKTPDGDGKESATSSECLACDDDKLPDLFLESKSESGLLPSTKKSEGNQLTRDDNSDVKPRMRGLQDLGLRLAPQNHKPSTSASSNIFQRHAPNVANAPLDVGRATEGTTHVSTRSMLDKRKISHDGQKEDSFGKKRDKRRPLVQVLETSAKLPVLHSSCLQYDAVSVSPFLLGDDDSDNRGHAKRSKCSCMTEKSTDRLESQIILRDPNEEISSGSAEDTETDSSQTDSLKSETVDAMSALSDDAAPIELVPKSMRRLESLGGCVNSKEPDDDLGLPFEVRLPFLEEPILSDVGVSKWQLKGKRNARNLAKRYQNVSYRNVPKGSTYGRSLVGGASFGYDDGDLFEDSFKTQMIGYGSRNLDDGRYAVNWAGLSWNDDEPAWRGRWEGSDESYEPSFVSHERFGRMNSMLFDVDLKVQSGYKRERVPIISLMSKLNGMAIVGHPVVVEAIASGSSETLLAASDDFQNEMLDYDSALRPMWRTARRTPTRRVPRPPLATLDGDEAAETFDEDPRIYGKVNAGRASQKARMLRKGNLTDRKIQSKPLKKMTLSSSAKIRKLSSISVQQYGSDLKLHRSSNSYQVERLIKSEPLPTAVACVPVKLVFSRLYEELVARINKTERPMESQ